jgi:hypothetical protein
MAKHPSLIGLTLIVGLLLAFPTSAAAQFLSWDDFLEQLYMEAEEQGAVSAIENLYDELQYHHANPININQAGINRLRNHPYLNFYQAKVIVEHRRKHGDIRSLKQLSLYEEFTETDLARLSPYVCFE